MSEHRETGAPAETVSAQTPAEAESTPAAPRRRRRALAAHGPYLVRRDGVRSMMADVMIALLPALLFSGFYFFGYRSFLVTAVSVASCVGL